MTKLNALFLMLLMLPFLFTGCGQKKLVLSEKEIMHVKDNTWAKETNVDENIGTADLERDMPAQTVENTAIVENTIRAKMERVAFPSSEYSRLAKTGKGTVKGSIFLKDAYERGIPGKSTRLFLNPVTSYSKQWYNESYLGGYKMQKADDRLFNYLRFTTSDESGRFAFYGVPTGSYYLIGTVKCGSECGYTTPKSVRIATQVSIRGNQVVEKSLTRLLD